MQDYIPIKIDINDEIPTVVIKQYDHLSRFLHFQIFDRDMGNESLDLTGCVVRLYMSQNNNAIAYFDGVVADGENGIITFNIPNGATQMAGDYKAEIEIKYPTGNFPVISTHTFIIRVLSSVKNPVLLQMTGQFAALDNALNNVDGLKNDIKVINARFDEIIALEDGSTTGDAELADIRVGHDGTIYESAGTAVRRQVEELEDSINNIREIRVGQNLVKPTKTTNGFISNSNGTITETNIYLTSVFIPITNNKTYAVGGYVSESQASPSQTRHGYLLYDASKQPITSSYNNTDNVSGLTVTISDSNAKYIRAFAHCNYLMVSESSTAAIPFINYSEEAINKMAIGNLGVSNINGLTAAGKNKINTSNSVTGSLGATGAISALTQYKTTDYIPVEANTAYTVSPKMRVYAFFDENKSIYQYDNTGWNSAETITSTQNGYVRITYWATDESFIMLEKGATSTSYDPYRTVFGEGILLNDTQVEDLSDRLYLSSLSGKKWAVCGDSFTSGATSNVLTSGKYTGQKKVYPYFIGNRTNIDVLRFFNSGQTLAYPSDGTFHNSLTDPTSERYYQNIPSDVDYITFYLGINDSHHEHGSSGTDGEDTTGVIPLGTINDADTSTYYGAWNVVLTWLIEHRPFAHIGIIVSNGCDRIAYRTAQIEIAAKYGIPYIDLNGDSRTPAMIRSLNPDIPNAIKQIIRAKQAVDNDGSITGSVNLHPNDDAHEYESYFIENFLRSL